MKGRADKVFVVLRYFFFVKKDMIFGKKVYSLFRGTTKGMENIENFIEPFIVPIGEKDNIVDEGKVGNIKRLVFKEKRLPFVSG